MAKHSGYNDPADQMSADNQQLLSNIYRRVNEAERFEDILWELEQDMLALLRAQRMTIYQRDPTSGEIVGWARDEYGGNFEIRVPLSTSSISGYVAMSHQPLRINDVYDPDDLASIHPSLSFDSSYDTATGFLTESMVVVPIKFKSTLLGVLQIINRIEGGAFSDDDVIHALAVANVLAQKFRNDMKSTSGPWDYLVEIGRLKVDQLMEFESEAEANNTRITKILMKKGKILEAELGASLEHFYQVPWMPFEEDVIPDYDLLERLDRTYLARNFWCPFRGMNDEVIILINDPNDADRIMEIQYLCNALTYEIRVGLKEDILRFLGYVIDDDDDKDLNLSDLLGRLEEEAKEAAEEEKKETKESAQAKKDADSDELLDENDSTIINIVNRLIVDAYELGASDIHIEPNKGTTPARVRLRIDGVCRKTLEVPATHIRAVIARIKVLSRLDIAERRKPQDGKMALKLRGRPLELRVATLPTVNGESAVLRILAAGSALPVEKLNLHPRVYSTCMRLLEKPHGIFLVVGPTGSGKTTTLHAFLGYMNTEDTKILTAEDPVEITQDGLQQVQVLPKIGYTFAMALRAFLRCDPDIILIGEMRDHETAHAGMEAALTGHLVFSTLHTNSAPETVVRLLDMGLDPLNFADALVGVVAQRLVRTLCKKCKAPYTPTDEELGELVHAYGEHLVDELVKDNEPKFHKPVGCEECGGSGYKGRTGVHELLEATKEMKNLISSKANVTQIKTLAVAEGLRTLRQDGIWKIFKGDTTYDQIRTVTVD